MKQEKIHGLSPEQFRALAERSPKLDGDWIYRLEQTYLAEVNDNMYPKFDTYTYQYMWFLTFDEAEEQIKKIAEKDKGEAPYCFHITQIPLRQLEEYGAKWLYDGHGNLVDYTVTKRIGDEDERRFFGRPDSRQRFRHGEIVEVIGDEEVSLAMIVQTPPTAEWCRERYEESSAFNANADFGYYLDASDDSYTVIDGPRYSYHVHVSPLMLMKPRFPIPAELEQEMRGWLETYDQPEPEQPQRPSKKIGDHLGDFYRLNLHIQHNPGSVPHIHIDDGHGLAVALRIDVPEYYPHEGDFNDKLTDGQIDALMEMLEYEDCGKSQWWYILREWNFLNEGSSSQPIPLTTPLPDYRLLKSDAESAKMK